MQNDWTFCRLPVSRCIDRQEEEKLRPPWINESSFLFLPSAPGKRRPGWRQSAARSLRRNVFLFAITIVVSAAGAASVAYRFILVVSHKAQGNVDNWIFFHLCFLWTLYSHAYRYKYAWKPDCPTKSAFQLSIHSILTTQQQNDWPVLLIDG